MNKPSKPATKNTDQTGKNIHESVSSSKAEQRSATNPRQAKESVKKNLSSVDATATATRTIKKKSQDKKSSRTPTARKKPLVAQTDRSTGPIKTSSNQPKASSDIIQEAQGQTEPDHASPNQTSETTQKDTAQTSTTAAGSTSDDNKSVITDAPFKENPQTEAVPSVDAPLEKESFATEATKISQPAEEAVTESREPEPQYIHPPLENKYLNKEALRNRLLLRQEFKPLIAYIGRLDSQKGVHLIRHGLFYALQNHAQFVLLGISPDPRINDEFWQLKHHLNENQDCHLELGFNEELAHLVYAGADMIIMPSLYEPCGLAQMIALKYGAVPIVRAVGGLVDTVFDRDYSDRAPHDRNGYVFHEPDATGLESAMSRAIGLWYDYPEEFRRLIINGMKYDYSWNFPGQHYINIYEYIRCK